MRDVLFALALLLHPLCGCGGEPLPGQTEAQEYILGRYAEEGVGDGTDVLDTVWYESQQCIPAPWDSDHKETCRRGRSWVIGPYCWIEVVWRDTSSLIGQTSFAHELLHCVLWQELGDPGHTHWAWDSLVHQVNAELLTKGL